ncbi:MAG: hypothetical protein ACYDC8_10480 [Gammaproteobacteria bacterium]
MTTIAIALLTPASRPSRREGNHMVTQYVAACHLEEIPPSSPKTVVTANHYNTRLETLLSGRSHSLPFSSFPYGKAGNGGRAPGPDHALPAVEYLKTSQVDTFGQVLRQKLLAKYSDLAKRYLNILVDEIVVNDKTATITGSYAALASAMGEIKRMGSLDQVPTLYT